MIPDTGAACGPPTPPDIRPAPVLFAEHTAHVADLVARGEPHDDPLTLFALRAALDGREDMLLVVPSQLAFQARIVAQSEGIDVVWSANLAAIPRRWYLARRKKARA